jgi:hypothetical protein
MTHVPPGTCTPRAIGERGSSLDSYAILGPCNGVIPIIPKAPWELAGVLSLAGDRRFADRRSGLSGAKAGDCSGLRTERAGSSVSLSSNKGTVFEGGLPTDTLGDIELGRGLPLTLTCGDGAFEDALL